MADDTQPLPGSTDEQPTPPHQTPLLSRRRLLALGVAGGAAAAATAFGVDWVQAGGTKRSPQASSPSSTPPSPATTATSTTASSAGNARTGILVVLTLYGGNDGLNTVIPIDDSAYSAARPTLGYARADALALANGLALHPNLHKLKQLWDQNQLAIVRGVGYPNPNRSHFRSMDIWQSGIPDRTELTGWLGRWLDTLPADPMTALAVGSTVPRTLIGATNSASAVPNAALTLPGSRALVTGFETLVSARAADTLSARIGQTGADLITVQHKLATILRTSAAPAPASASNNLEAPGDTAAPLNNQLATQLELVARAIAGNAPTRVYGVSLGGFDTHAQEKANHARLMTELDDALGWFIGRLAAIPGGRDVVVMAHSEFGRRVAENSSGGTDHGTAAPVFVLGSRVRSGFHGDEPSLSALDNGDLKFTTDFRTVYASMLEQVLQADSKAVLGGRFTPLDLVS